MALNFLSQLTGSFAMPAAENPTVAMVEAAYRHHGLDIRYINCEVPPEKLADAVKGARAMGWIGFNCSIPHKVAVIEHVDRLGDSAKVIGAVNCAVRRGEKFIGENTDGKGFLQSLREAVDPAGKQVVMFGAGGAARAIGVELALAGATRITVVNRSESRGRTLVDLLNRKTKTEPSSSFKTAPTKFRRKPTLWSTRPLSVCIRTLTAASILTSEACARRSSSRTLSPIRRALGSFATRKPAVAGCLTGSA
jgi:shikimate dehydrogenase